MTTDFVRKYIRSHFYVEKMFEIYECILNERWRWEARGANPYSPLILCGPMFADWLYPAWRLNDGKIRSIEAIDGKVWNLIISKDLILRRGRLNISLFTNLGGTEFDFVIFEMKISSVFDPREGF